MSPIKEKGESEVPEAITRQQVIHDIKGEEVDAHAAYVEAEMQHQN